MIVMESVYSENRGIFLDESWPFIESKISQNKKKIIIKKSTLEDVYVYLIFSSSYCRLLTVFIFHLNAAGWATGIYIYILEGMWYGKGGQAECEAAHWEGTPAIELDHSTFVKVCNFFQEGMYSHFVFRATNGHF